MSSPYFTEEHHKKLTMDILGDTLAKMVDLKKYTIHHQVFFYHFTPRVQAPIHPLGLQPLQDPGSHTQDYRREHRRRGHRGYQSVGRCATPTFALLVIFFPSHSNSSIFAGSHKWTHTSGEWDITLDNINQTGALPAGISLGDALIMLNIAHGGPFCTL
jgi:hypothetical protein